MEPRDGKEVVDEVYGFIRVYSDGTVERPPFPGGHRRACSAFLNGIATKDVGIDRKRGLWARLFLPECVCLSQRRAPLVLHFHGGGFCAGSPAAASFHKFCSLMAMKSESIWVSVDYRLAPEHRLPAAYDDGLAAFLWLCSQSEMQGLHSNGKAVLPVNGANMMSEDSSICSAMRVENACENVVEPNVACRSFSGHSHESQSHGVSACKAQKQHDSSSGQYMCGQAHADGPKDMRSDPWLLNYADFSNCFLAGESAGGAIVHNLMARLSHTGYSGVQIRGLLLIHSSFLVKGLYERSLTSNYERRPNTYRRLCLPLGASEDHPLLNPLHPEAYSFKDISFPPALIAVADQDMFYEPSLCYAHVMKQHGHIAELHISKEEGHCFYLYHARSKKAEAFYECLVAFMHRHCMPQQGRSLL